jgi:hypothetical protein
MRTMAKEFGYRHCVPMSTGAPGTIQYSVQMLDRLKNLISIKNLKSYYAIIIR